MINNYQELLIISLGKRGIPIYHGRGYEKNNIEGANMRAPKGFRNSLWSLSFFIFNKFTISNPLKRRVICFIKGIGLPCLL
jgi:hypothetical protein